MKLSSLFAIIWVQLCPFKENVSSLDWLRSCHLLFTLVSAGTLCVAPSPTARASPALVKVRMSHSNEAAALGHIWHPPAHLSLPFALNEPCKPPFLYLPELPSSGKEGEGLLATQPERESFNANPLHWGLLGWVTVQAASTSRNCSTDLRGEVAQSNPTLE